MEFEDSETLKGAKDGSGLCKGWGGVLLAAAGWCRTAVVQVMPGYGLVGEELRVLRQRHGST